MPSAAAKKNQFQSTSPLEDDVWIEWLRLAWEVDSCKADVIRSIVENVLNRRSRIGLQIIQNILSENPVDFIRSCFEIKNRPNSLAIFDVPIPLRSIAKLTDRNIGAGEIVLLFMISESECSFGGPFDVTLFSEKWHVKQITKCDRRGRMGNANSSCYMLSDTATALHKIDRLFIKNVSQEMIALYEREIAEKFGSMDDFWKSFRKEFLDREFSQAAGICFFDQDNNVIEFHRKEDIILSGATQGTYRIAAKVKG